MTPNNSSNRLKQKEILSEAEIEQVLGEAYTRLAAAGFSGGMGGDTWDKAAARAIESAVLSKLRAPVADERPLGAIINGRTLAERLEAYPFESEGGDLRLCSDWVEFRRCFEHLAEWVSTLASAPATGPQPVIHHHGFASDNQKLRAINESLDKQLDEVMTERDNHEDYIDKLLDIVLGAERTEWSSAYDHSDALVEVEERIHALASAPVAGDARPVAYLHTSNRMLTWPGKLTEVQLNSGVWRPLYDRPAAPQASEAVRDSGIAASVDQLVTAAKGMTKLYPHVWDRTDGSLVVFPENVAQFDAAFDALRVALGEAVEDDDSAALAAQPAASAEPSDALSENEWYDLAQRHATRDWNGNGYMAAIQAVCLDFLSRYGRPAGDAQPVAWVAADTLNSPHPKCISSLAYMSQIDQDRGREYVPLYAAPVAAQKADDARDAARWRWFTDDHNDPRVRADLRALFDRLPVMSYSAACAAIDAAIAKQRKGED